MVYDNNVSPQVKVRSHPLSCWDYRFVQTVTKYPQYHRQKRIQGQVRHDPANQETRKYAHHSHFTDKGTKAQVQSKWKSKINKWHSWD